MRLSAYFLASVVLAACATGASAQRMYRCGSTYQDRPCETGSPDKVFRSGGMEAPSANALKTVGDPECIKRGADATQIVWARESGKTADDQNQLAQSDAQRRLIAEVYAGRGSAPQVRDAIQAKCQQDKERAAQAAAIVAEALKVQAAGSPMPEPKPASPDAARDPAPAKAVAAPSSSACEGFKAQLDNVLSQEHQGGSAQFMESLRNRRASVESAARAKGCR